MLHGNTMFAVSAAIDVAIAGAYVLWAVRFRPRLPLLAGGLALVCALLLGKLAVMVAAGLGRPFGVAHVLYLDLVVVVPTAALLLALLRWRDGGWLVRALAVAGLLLAPIGAYASFVEPQRLVVERTEVPLSSARAGEQAVTVAVLADLQFEHLGEHERRAVDRALELRPDVILLAGDYQQGSRASFERELPGLRRLMSRLHAPGGVYAVQGDQEPSIEDTRRIFAGTGVRLLVNETVTTSVADRRLTIAGLELNYRTPAAARTIARLQDAPGADDLRILLAHRPDPVLRLAPDSRVDLLVAGHTHGGQIQLPLYGAFRTASSLPREVCGGGLHALDGRRIYVSRGIGVERGEAPKLRFNAPPEISLLELR
ncbi:metallophosphoesterase [Conexibacter sp. JD483]|uniref:metallophosphoesterase n=1 Tax=unclassified Conexibacter TaxID=2627773 RepID=UPI00271DEF04|nr:MULTISPECIES: metallophosphoesterase [unclassified Conexibacter]MDO8187985.1 metallophosphoesterase [Conexibacter sp. CPCC 205706]MDO8200868.1 metallophosphoesterase [Conexibacter sp. CPCC 205762]MDR9370399.1 metallophosphoesterase [Conexibacter sp. JD483]